MQIYVNCNDSGATWNKKRYLQAADQRLRLGVFHDIREADMQADYVLNIEPFDFKTGKKWTGIWQIDNIFGAGKYEEWDRADDVFTAVSSVQEGWDIFSNKTTLLFQACDPTFNKRVGIPEYDFVMCGSGGDAYVERGRCTDILKTKFTWCQFEKGRSPQDYCGILNKARVQFIRSANTRLADGEIAQRFFECLAIGPVLTNWVPDLLHTGLIEGEDYLAYRNDEEMVAKFKMLLDPGYAVKVANNGRKKALLYHCYEHRIVTILQTINAHTLS